ncbi:MAG: 5-formyltetrahydrofolate cyclo-ligase [Syntrophomonadaceae bacterium]|nr:5-formyltetrahydrofolate cyclo-ligase [Syntrophomonadaceae bacterium]
MDSFGIKDLKHTLRQTMLTKRRTLGAGEVARRSKQIAEFLIASSSFHKAKAIMAYAPLHNEVDTELLLQAALGQQKQVLLPVAEWENRQLRPVSIKSYPDSLVAGRYGILEPAQDRQSPWPVEQIDLVIVPGVAFDVQGYRLGYGQGFYDRFLGRLSPRTEVIGLAYDFQVVETVYPEKHDVIVPMIVTEKGVINTPGSRRI